MQMRAAADETVKRCGGIMMNGPRNLRQEGNGKKKPNPQEIRFQISEWRVNYDEMKVEKEEED